MRGAGFSTQQAVCASVKAEQTGTKNAIAKMCCSQDIGLGICNAVQTATAYASPAAYHPLTGYAKLVRAQAQAVHAKVQQQRPVHKMSAVTYIRDAIAG